MDRNLAAERGILLRQSPSRNWCIWEHVGLQIADNKIKHAEVDVSFGEWRQATICNMVPGRKIRMKDSLNEQYIGTFCFSSQVNGHGVSEEDAMAQATLASMEEASRASKVPVVEGSGFTDCKGGDPSDPDMEEAIALSLKDLAPGVEGAGSTDCKGRNPSRTDMEEAAELTQSLLPRDGAQHAEPEEKKGGLLSCFCPCFFPRSANHRKMQAGGSNDNGPAHL